MEFPLDVVLWGIRDVFPLLEMLPQKRVGVLRRLNKLIDKSPVRRQDRKHDHKKTCVLV